MGAYVEPFDKEFLKRTRSIIKNVDLIRYNVTLLLNCTLALVCLPIEKCNDDYGNNQQAYNDLFARLCTKMDALLIYIVEQRPNTPAKQKLKCLRNGIAHVKMTAVNETEKIAGVSITGSTKLNGTTYTCTFEFSKKQLREFSLYMADEYLRI